jgi:general stress protein 26
MMVQDAERTRLWFFTNNDGEKYYDIVDHSDVNLSFSSPEHNHYISISGTASFVDDRRKIHQLWTPLAKAWFSEGPDDPKLSLMLVEIRGAEYWDIKSGMMVQLIEYVKASFGAKAHEKAVESKNSVATHAKLSSHDLHA